MTKLTFTDEEKGVLRDGMCLGWPDAFFQEFVKRCEATGLSEDMLSHVLAGRKDLSLAKLTGALGRIGYRLRIVPLPECARPQKQKQTG